ncbi:MAG: DMT family transporter [Acidobacteria bacterium]|nr:DMT family transporter [Acidobacteriota bacterium]
MESVSGFDLAEMLAKRAGISANLVRPQDKVAPGRTLRGDDHFLLTESKPLKGIFHEAAPSNSRVRIRPRFLVRSGSPLLIGVEPFHLSSLLSLDAKGFAAFLFLAFLMYGASMLLFFAALQHLDINAASMSLYLVPVFGVLLAWLVLGEHLSPASLAGAAIVLISTLLVVRYDTSY